MTPSRLPPGGGDSTCDMGETPAAHLHRGCTTSCGTRPWSLVLEKNARGFAPFWDCHSTKPCFGSTKIELDLTRGSSKNERGFPLRPACEIGNRTCPPRKLNALRRRPATCSMS